MQTCFQTFKRHLSLSWAKIALVFCAAFCLCASACAQFETGKYLDSGPGMQIPGDSLALEQIVERSRQVIDSASAHTLFLLDRVIAKSKAHNYLRVEAMACVVKGKIYQKWESPNRSRKVWKEAAKILVQYPLDHSYLDLMRELSKLELENQNGVAALEWITKYQQVAKKIGTQEQIAHSHTLFGRAYGQEGQRKQSEEFFLKAKEEYEKADYLAGMMNNSLQSAKVKLLYQDCSAALKDLHQAWNPPKTLRLTHRSMEICLVMGEAYMCMGEGDSALLWFHQGSELSKGLHFDLMDRYKHSARAAKLLANAYELLGMHKEAFLHYNEFVLRQNEYILLHNQIKKKGFEEKYHYLQAIHAKKVEEQAVKEIKNRNFWLKIAAAGTMLLALMLVALKLGQVRNARKLRAKDLALRKLRKTKSTQDSKIIDQSLSEKKQQLKEFMQTSLKEETFFQVVGKQLEQYVAHPNPAEKDRLELLQLLENLPSEDQMWAQLRKYFDHLFPDFLDQLVVLYPSLSPTDVRLLAFLRLGLSSKEIARISARTAGSVDVSRHRLRHKLSLNPDQRLMPFLLKQLSAEEYEEG